MLEVVTLENENRWLEIIKQFKSFDVYYLPQYTKAFRIHGDGEPMLFYFESEKIKAANVVMKRDISDCEYFRGAFEKNAWFDISTPYGYGGFIIEGEEDSGALEQFSEEYCEYCKSSGIISEFVRFHPLLKNHQGLESIYEIKVLGKTVSMDLSSVETINSNLEPKTFKLVRKARNNGIKVSFGNSKELFSAFKELYDETMDRDNAAKYYYFGQDFYKSIMNDLKDNVIVFYSMLDEEIIAANIVLFCNRNLHSHLQSSKTEFMHLAPVTLMRYETALWGCNNGFKEFHLGGGVGASEDSLYRFKKKFNINSDYQFVIGRKIFDSEKYAWLLDLRKKVALELKPNFFPEYRA